MSFKGSAFALFAAVVFGTGAIAQAPHPNTAELTFGAGYNHLNTGNAFVVGKQNHGIMAASLSYNLLSVLSVGAEYSFSRLDKEQVGSVTGVENLHNYGGVARVGILGAHRVTPFVLVSGGGLSLNDNLHEPNVSYTVDTSGTYVGAGAGATVWLGHHLGVRPEARFQREHLNVVASTMLTDDSNRHEFLLTGSLVYTIGGQRSRISQRP